MSNIKIQCGNYTEAEPYTGNCYPPNYWICQKEPGMTLQEFADSHALTYEGVRRKILKYKDALIPHIRIKSGAQYLDDAAVDFLETHGRKKTVKSEIIEISELTELRQKVTSLMEENEALKTKCQSLSDKLKQKTEEYNEVYENYQSQLKSNVLLSNEMILNDRRNQHIIDTQFTMLREAGIMTPDKLSVLLDAMNWNGLIEKPKKPVSMDRFSLDLPPDDDDTP